MREVRRDRPHSYVHRIMSEPNYDRGVNRFGIFLAVWMLGWFALAVIGIWQGWF